MILMLEPDEHFSIECDTNAILHAQTTKPETESEKKSSFFSSLSPATAEIKAIWSRALTMHSDVCLHIQIRAKFLSRNHNNNKKKNGNFL